MSILAFVENSDPASLKKAFDTVAQAITAESSDVVMYIGKLGQDGHDRGQAVVTTGLQAVGIRAIRGPLFETPEELVENALKYNAHVIGVSILSGAHMSLVPELLDILSQKSVANLPVIVGGIIPPDDVQKLKDMGVKAVFTPGTRILDDVVPEVVAQFKEFSQILREKYRWNSPDNWYTKLQFNPWA